jgi:transcriptional regulator with XRE-family HTH domain
MTQKELADRLGVNQSMISDYESGKVDLSLTKAVKIADILECDLNDLLGRSAG